MLGITRRQTLASGAAVPLAACATVGDRGGRLDLSRFEMTFEDTFTTLDISPWGPGTRWIAHTPWNGDFGAARFADPEPGFPFTTGPRGLRIEARQEANGAWRSGLICSLPRDGPQAGGWGQAMGYFEIRTRLPTGAGVWPAFWLVGVKDGIIAELDPMEFYGHAPDRYQIAAHVWDTRTPGAHRSLYTTGHTAMLRRTYSLNDRDNDFGVWIRDDWIIFYLNRQEMWRIPTREEFRWPMHILANLALGGGWPHEGLESPKFMQIAWIRAYRER